KEDGVFTLALSDEERLIQETARRFARDRLLPELRAHERARAVPPEVVREFAGLGLAGGEDLGAFARALVLEELAAVDPGAALALARARAGIRTAVGALLVGAARGAHEYAMRYATERTAFGRPIAHHQALAFLIADLATAVDVARLAVWRAAAALDRGESGEW